MEYLVSILVVSSIGATLSVILVIADAYLSNYGECKININDEKDITIQGGSSLLTSLAGQGIFLGSACGGRATCGYCKAKVISGGGFVLPTETTILTPAEVRSGIRLTCQVKVREDMQIEIPEEAFKVQKFSCTVRSNRNVSTFIKELVLGIDDGKTLDFKPGEYVQIDIPSYKASFEDFDIPDDFKLDWDEHDLWRYSAISKEPTFRAYSMANHPAEGDIIKLNVRIATPPRGMKDVPPGIASSYIFNLKSGDKATVTGPYGEFHIKDTDKEMVYIGGGAGMAPLHSHIFHLFYTLDTKRKVSYWYGARSKREIFYEEEFRELEEKFPNFKFVVALSEPLPEDNWDGPVGFVHQVTYDLYLKDHKNLSDVEFYLCGPPMMLKACLDMFKSLGVEDDQVAYDEF